MDRELVLELPSDVRSIEHAVDYVVQRCKRCEDYAHKLHLNFRVGLTEALSNAMMYGNGHDPKKNVRIEVTMVGGSVRARVTDEGCGFDPAAIPDPTTPGNLLKDGGRGLFLMRKLLDEVSYNDQGNSVTLVLRLDAESVLEGGASA
jgi:serine/threonine-protein kinase RsbW